MLPPFRSTSSALGFCGLLIVLLCLPFATEWIEHPSREQAYAALPESAGPVGLQASAISGESPDADILFLGSSLTKAAIDLPAVERALSSSLGRPAHVSLLGMNWQGLDLQYFLLRDYLSTHRPDLMIWNPPAPGSRILEPHIMAYRWVRFGEYSDALSGLPLRFRLALYGDMVLGAPREMLSLLRPNLLSREEMQLEEKPTKMGYYGADFVPESVRSAATPPLVDSYEDPPYSQVRIAGEPLDPYEVHFAKKIVELAQEKHVKIALLHIPIDSEQGLDVMPEQENWPSMLHTGAPLIGVSSAVLFAHIDRLRFYHFYRDQHFNSNGETLFTQAIVPAILKAYDERMKHE